MTECTNAADLAGYGVMGLIVVCMTIVLLAMFWWTER